MKTSVKLNIVAGKASLQPPIGPILGQYGIPGRKFCQDFNDQTKIYNDNIILSVKVILYNKKIKSIKWEPNRSYFFQRLIFKLRVAKKINESLVSEEGINILDLNSKIKNISTTKPYKKRRKIQEKKYTNSLYIEDLYKIRYLLVREKTEINIRNKIKELMGSLETMNIIIRKKNV